MQLQIRFILYVIIQFVASMQTSGEVADTTEASNGGAPHPAPAAVATESEREAASVAQIEAPSAAEPCVRVRRDTEPVTTSLSTEEHSHTSDNAQVIAYCHFCITLSCVVYCCFHFLFNQPLFVQVLVRVSQKQTFVNC